MESLDVLTLGFWALEITICVVWRLVSCFLPWEVGLLGPFTQGCVIPQCGVVTTQGMGRLL